MRSEFNIENICGTRVTNASLKTGAIVSMHQAWKDFGFPTVWVKWDHLTNGKVYTDSLDSLTPIGAQR